ncbi:tetratricopeptide repeat protein [Alloacidobacterium sp.]|uniref:tetratricopeptide repeat protein n=1 Tax=Alloacidobacterium sp. TaxID=2951999 RepID=UPI002D61A436|nr:tetratricopeptide repeat protein [Alloacidobacterium sp.]HYK35514.1 tetratricopeptide repeat protein [Alloacidobacterium sp.]
MFELRSTLTPEERQQRQKLILRDTLALSSLLLIVIVLFFVTLALFHSFTIHRQRLAKRWLARGEYALHAGQPLAAIDALRSALAYAPDDETLQIELAEALAADGRTQEAVAYFNTLLESRPGSGMVNLQLARLAVKQGEEANSLDHYEEALDGTWEGDGYTRRREVRLELAQYLIDRKHYDRARNELLIAAGNAPDDINVQLQIAGLLESAQDQANALHLYRRALQHRPERLAALEGAGRTAYALNRFLQAKKYLERALNHPEFEKQPTEAQAHFRDMLADADHILLLFPGPELSLRARADRILSNRKIAQERLAECLNTKTAVLPELQALADQWQHLPDKLSLLQLEQDPQLEQTIMQLVYQTERVTSQQCGAPMGDDALLLKIAEAPEAVEQL